MSPAPSIEFLNGLTDADPAMCYVRRVRQVDVVANADTGAVELLPQKAFQFNPDLSLHQVAIIESLGSNVPREYVVPPNGALKVPVASMVTSGAYLKHTPHTRERVLGPAHHSLFGQTRKPSMTDKADMRDVLMSGSEWLGDPPVPVPTELL